MKKNTFLYTFIVIVAILCAAGIVLAETASSPTMKKAQPKPAAPAASPATPPAPATPAAPVTPEVRVPAGRLELKAPDLVAELSYTKYIIGGKGTITFNGRVCNRGTANYQSPPMGPAQGTLASYDPARPLTADNYQVVASLPVISLAIGACTPQVNSTYEIPLIIQWEHRRAVAGECAASREFSMSVGRNVPDDPAFRRTEDSDPANNTRKKSVQYMVQCPW